LAVGVLTLFLWGFSSVAAEDPARQLRVETEIQKFFQRGDNLCVGFGSVWTMSDRNNLMRIALADNAVTEIPIDSAPAEFRRTVAGEGAVWVADSRGRTIYKVDPKTNLVVMTIPADFPVTTAAAGEIGVGEGSVWAITGSSSDQILRRYSSQTGVEQATIPLPSPSARGIVFDFGSIWIAGLQDEQLYRIDPATNQIVGTIELQSRPVTLTSGEGSVWVREFDGTVQRIDGSSGELLATFATDASGGYGDIVVGGGIVWTNSAAVPLVQIDPRTNSQRARFDAPPGAAMGYRMTYGGGSLWLGGFAVYRIKPPE
jgi:streptogramin lyase